MEIAIDAKDVVGAVFIVLMGTVGYFLRQKDHNQEKDIEALRAAHEKDMKDVRAAIKGEIDKLWQQHHLDKDDLKEYKLVVANKHYPMDTIDKKFEKIERSIEAGFEKVNDSLDRLNAILLGRALEKGDKHD